MAEKKPTIAQLQDQLSSVREASNQHRSDLTQARGQLEVTRKIIAEKDGEISYLKDELHRMTVENARLEGYRDRVHEFDPVTERIQYADRQHPMREAQVSDRDFAEMSRHYKSGSPAPWYRRG